MAEETVNGGKASPVTDLVDPATRARRRDRLQTLLAKGGFNPPAAARPAAPAQALGGKVPALLRNKGVQSAYRMLVDTPPDADGMVADTPFSVAGLKKLVESIKARSGQDGQAGSKAAQALLTFMAPAGPDEDQVEGLSVAKLQRLAKLARPGAQR